MVKHAFVSARSDDTDPSLIQPSHWNADHAFDGGALGSLLYRDPVPSIGASWLAAVAAGALLRSTGVGAAPAWSTTTWPNSATQGDLLIATGANAWGSLADVATGSVLVSGGVGANPAWSATPTLTGLVLGTSGSLAWSTDLFLVRDAANVLAQRNGTSAQTSRVYNTFTDASNYERGILTWASNTFFIATQGLGTGSTRNIVVNAPIVTLRSGGSTDLIWSTSGLQFSADNTYDIGAGSLRPRNLLLGGLLTLSGGTLLATSAALTNGSAASTATLTNAPAAGNPTKWIPINDSGTTRYIPAW